MRIVWFRDFHVWCDDNQPLDFLFGNYSVLRINGYFVLRIYNMCCGN